MVMMNRLAPGASSHIAAAPRLLAPSCSVLSGHDRLLNVTRAQVCNCRVLLRSQCVKTYYRTYNLSNTRTLVLGTRAASRPPSEGR